METIIGMEKSDSSSEAYDFFEKVFIVSICAQHSTPLFIYLSRTCVWRDS